MRTSSDGGHVRNEEETAAASANNPSNKDHRLLRRFAVLGVFLLCAAMLNVVLTIVLVPYGSKSEIAWKDYAKEDEIDCIIVGTSTAMRDISPQVLDERMGAKSFNLSTPSQTLDESFVAVRTADEDHGLTRVILGIAPSQLLRAGAPNPGSAFMFARSHVVSVPQQLEAVGYMMFEGGAIAEPVSLNMIFPWVSNKISDSVGAMIRNARMKLDGTTVYEAAEVNEAGWTYVGKGFGGYSGKLNYSSSKAQSYFTTERTEDVGVEADKAGSMDPRRQNALVDLCDYCAAHGIELYVITPPLPEYNIIEYGSDYFVLGDKTRNLVESHGGHYFDANMAKPELYESKEAYFSDAEHLNFNGADVFSSSLCDLMKAVEAGEDVSSLFLVGEDEYLTSVDGISCVFADTAPSASGVEVTARALAGSAVDVEYQFCLRDGDSWVEARGWSDDPVAELMPLGGARGPFKVRINTRQKGHKKTERFRELWAMY